MMHIIRETPIEEPQALLERELIAAYAAGAGYDVAVLLTSNDEGARRILADASRYASDKLAEVEARSHYIHALRGQT
jgi:hypothetical protein